MNETINVSDVLEIDELYSFLSQSSKISYKKYYNIYHKLWWLNHFTDFLLSLDSDEDKFKKFSSNYWVTEDWLFLLIKDVISTLNDNKEILKISSDIKWSIDIILLSKFDEIYKNFDNKTSILNDDLKGLKWENVSYVFKTIIKPQWVVILLKLVLRILYY